LVFDSSVSTRTRTVTDDLGGCTGRAAISPGPRFGVRELGEIDMVSMALATLDLVTRDDALEPPGTGSWLRPRSASCPADQ